MSRLARALAGDRSRVRAPVPIPVPIPAQGGERRPGSPLPGPLLLELLAAVLEGGAPPAAALGAIAAGLRSAGDGRARAILLMSGRVQDPPRADGGGEYSIGRSGAQHWITEPAGFRPLPPDISKKGGLRTKDRPGDALLADLEEELLLAARTGLAPTALIRRAAAESRRRQAAAHLKAIRRLEVLLVVPAGICLLPAFVLLGVAPLVIGLFRG